MNLKLKFIIENTDKINLINEINERLTTISIHRNNLLEF